MLVQIIKAVGLVIAFVVGTVIPCVVKLKKANAERKAAVTEAAKQKAINDMFYAANNFIEAAEKTFKGFDTVMKSQGSSAGSLKKDTVMTKLQAYAMQNGYVWDEDFWSQQIDNIVAMTKEVNAKK